MNQKRRTILSVAAAMGTLAFTATSANAAVLLTTDFSGATISVPDPNTAVNITWTATGLTAPDSLTLGDVVANQNDGQLFDYAGGVTTTNGYFGGNTNLSRSPSDGQWGTTVPLTVSAGGVTLSSVLINLVHANKEGGANAGSHTTQITATVFDNNNDVVGTVTSPNFTPTTGNGGDLTLTFGSPLTLGASGTYTVSFLVESNSGSGHYAAFNALTLSGDITAIPEPATTALLGLGGLALIFRRRK